MYATNIRAHKRHHFQVPTAGVLIVPSIPKLWAPNSIYKDSISTANRLDSDRVLQL